MKIKFSNNLIKLSKILGGGVYVVGGSVRNHILKLPKTDIDICGKYTPNEVIDKLKGSNYQVISDYASFGSLLIKIGKEKYEYTTFRMDSYKLGKHKPFEVKFIDDINVDALRRDFTINAIYYDLLKNEIVDPTGYGVNDIKEGILRTCNGKQTFIEDGLRLLRLVRFYGEFGFSIEEKSLNYAKECNDNLADIVAERKRDELNKILVCDIKYGKIDNNRVYNTLSLMNEIGLFQHLLPDLLKGVSLMQNCEYHSFDVFTHNLKVCSYAKPSIRLAALLHDVGKPQSYFELGNYHFHDEIGSEITKKLLGQNGLKYSNEVVSRCSRLISEHMKDLNADMKERKLRIYFAENSDILDDLISLKIADGYGCKDEDTLSNTVVKWIRLYKEMKDEKVPLSIKDLKIKGDEVIEIIGKDNAKYTGLILNKLLEYGVVKEVKNKNSDLKKIVIRAYKEVKNANNI